MEEETKNENNITHSNSTKLENEDSNNTPKLSYKKDLWMYFDSIKDKFYNDRAKTKTLLYIISQKNDLEYEYSQSLKNLYTQFTLEFDNKINQKNIGSTYNDYSLNIIINDLINNLKYESELYSNHSEDIIESVIKPLEGFIMNQCELYLEFIKLMESYENEFKYMNNILEQKQLSFHQGGKELETAMNHLQDAKKKNTTEEDLDPNQNIFNLDEENKNDEIIEKLSDTVEKNKKTAKILQMEYNNYLIKANAEREKYIQLSEKIYDKVQTFDEEFITMMKKQITLLMEKDLTLLENIKTKKTNILEKSQQINIENEIMKFINSKLTKFKPPKPFEYIDYIPDIIIKKRKNYVESIQQDSSVNIIENLKIFFKSDMPTVNEIEEENLRFINDTVNDIWEENSYNKEKLDSLFKEHLYRFRFLRMLNQYRIEGIFILKNNSFKNFCVALSSLLEKALKEEDYESIKLCMILSQTFYLQGDKKIILQSAINSNPIFQNKNFWIKIIEYSISEEINSNKGYLVFMEEHGKAREKRIESTIISNLITYSFNMKLFGYSEEDVNIIIDEFIKKYKIDGSMVYASTVSMKEITGDIIVESIENIVNNNEIKEDKGNNNNNTTIKKTNTIDSKNEDINNEIINDNEKNNQ